MSSPRQSEVDVLIIGAGPAGLMCATALAKAGINFRIVDKRPVKVAAGQADGLSPRTLEVFQSYGIANRVLREGAQVYMAAFYDPGPEGGIQLSSRTLDVTAPSARYPFEVNLHQGAIESIFLNTLKSHGAEVERATLPTKIEVSTDAAVLADPTAHAVKVTLDHQEAPEGEREEIVHAKFVLGADGAHSWVRKTFNIDMEGEQTDFIWGVLDMVPDTDLPDVRNKTLIHSNNGSILMVPREEDRNRIYIQLNDNDVVNAETGRVDKDKMGPEKLLEVARRTFSPFRLDPTNGFHWWTVYIIGQRVASSYSVHNRVFIAGDACHTHSPKAGQGMNASMNDTHNLAWKLAFVLRGWAELSLLSTYESERRKFAQDLISFDKTFSTLFSGKAASDDDTDGVSHEKFKKAFQYFGGLTSGIGIHYAPSAIISEENQSLATNLIIGERVPPQQFLFAGDARPYELQDLLPSNSRYKVLVFSGDLNNSAQQETLESLARNLQRPDSFFTKWGSTDSSKSPFDFITISKGKKEDFDLRKVPSVLRPHWSKVLIDDVDVRGQFGGEGYSYYGVADEGAIVAVRPDGYVGAVVPLNGVAQLTSYFAQFMKA